MGEPTCLMQQQPFSYAAGIPNQSNEGNPIHTLGQSVSFGRFMSESLAWEKWSSFSHNRYVEEAERFSRPGSVAQKKAFFEAHYKNLAARKAAALLEQANAAANKVPEPEQGSEVQDNITQDAENVISNSELDLVKPGAAAFIANDSGHNLHVELENSEGCKVLAVDPVTENEAAVEDCVKVEFLSHIGASDEEEEVKETKLSGRKLTEKPLLKDFISKDHDSVSMRKKQPAVSSSKSLISGRAIKLLCSPAKPAVPFHASKENNATPISKKSAVVSMDRKKATPKSTHRSMNFTPVREINKIRSTIIRKIDNSRVGSNSKVSKDCSTPLRTPTTSSMLRESKNPLATPQSENRRAKTPIHPSASARKTIRKWHFLPTDCSKFISACRNKSQSPNLCTPFNLRTEERAARRKERLEEKFNVNQKDKVQLQATLKEKAETEIKKLRQSICFKARPLPKFYKERTTLTNQMEKVLLTQPESPNLARTPIHSMVQPSQKNSGSKQIMGKKSDNPRSLASRLRQITRENTSPNIQQE